MCFSIDATLEPEFGPKLGRLVNHSAKANNAFPKVVSVDDVPYVCLFSNKDIPVGQQILYNYGVVLPFQDKLSVSKNCHTLTPVFLKIVSVVFSN